MCVGGDVVLLLSSQQPNVGLAKCQSTACVVSKPVGLRCQEVSTINNGIFQQLLHCAL